MVIALDPRIPRVWRTPDTLQFGVEVPRLVLRRVSVPEERMIAALGDGVSLPGLRMIAKRSRADPATVDALLRKLSPVLERAPAVEAIGGLVVLDGEGRTAGRVVGLLRAAGVDVRSGLSWSDPLIAAASLAVVVGSYAIEPSRHGRWLRRDVPHLPVVFGDGGVSVGPLVVPGGGPCVRCVDLHRRDADPAWPAMAAQLHERPRPGETELVRDAVAAVTAALVIARLAGGETIAPSGPQAAALSTRFEHTSGSWVTQEHMPHPECGCLGLPVSPRASLPGPPAPPPDARSERAERAPRGSAKAGATPAGRGWSHGAPS